MTIGNPEVIKCPSCGDMRLRMTFLSWNNIGASYYTDGYESGDMVASVPHFTKCPACGAYFKISKAIIAGAAELSDKRPYVEEMPVRDYRGAIKEGLFNGAEQGSEEWAGDMLAMRMMLWRAFNGRNRNERRDSPPWMDEDEKTAYEENARELLLQLADRAQDDIIITRAELHRNLGEFDACKALLRTVADSGGYHEYIDVITEACDGKTTKTKIV